MRRTMTALCLAAAASWVVTVSAQSGMQSGSGSGSQSGSSTQSGSQSENQMKHQKSGNKMTVTGCLMADPSGKGYRLTNVSMDQSGTGMSGSMSGSGTETGSESGSQSGSSTSGQTGTSGSMSSSNASMSVELIGKSSELKSHVGERVEVTGTPMGKDRSSQGTSGRGSESVGSMSGSGSETGSGSGSGGSMSGSPSSMAGGMAHRLRVDSIRAVGGSCSAQ